MRFCRLWLEVEGGQIMPLVIIGNSAAGLSALDTLIKHQKEKKVILINEENGPPYSKVLTSYFVAGKISEGHLYLRDMSYFEENKIETLLGTKVLEVLPQEKEIKTDNKGKLEFSKLLIATGARPYIPSLPGIDLEGVFSLRTLKDAQQIKKYAGNKKRAVVLGGGPVGLKVAWALKNLGLKVTIIVGSPQILSRLLPRQPALIVGEHLENKGYKILTKTQVEAIEGQEKVEKVVFSSGEEIPADIVVVGKGIHPNTELVQGSGINVDWGIPVDEYQETNIPGIFAAGDVAQGKDILGEEKSVAGIWPVAVGQGRVAGENMLGFRKTYPGFMSINVLELDGITIGGLGLSCSKGPEYSHVRVWEKEIYKELIIKGNRVVGGVFLNDLSPSGFIETAVKNKVTTDRLPSLEDLLWDSRLHLKAFYEQKRILRPKGGI